MQFTFVHDEQSALFCEEIVHLMMTRFNLSLPEALGRVNRYFDAVALRAKKDFVGESLWYHEATEHWASFIYYGGYEHQKGANPQPIPYP